MVSGSLIVFVTVGNFWYFVANHLLSHQLFSNKKPTTGGEQHLQQKASSSNAAKLLLQSADRRSMYKMDILYAYVYI